MKNFFFLIGEDYFFKMKMNLNLFEIRFWEFKSFILMYLNRVWGYGMGMGSPNQPPLHSR